MTFSHKKNPILNDYFIDDVKIERVFEIRDLVVIMDSKLSFVSHFEYIKKSLV